MTALAERPVAQRTKPAARTSPERPRGALPLLPAVALAAASGIVLAAAFPAANVWVLVFVGLGGQLAALRGRTFAGGLLVGFAGGLTFWIALIHWVTLFLGPVPLIALGSLEAIICGLGGGVIAVAYRRVPLVWTGRGGRVGVAPLLVAAAWTGREALASTAPYGGFGWGRLAESQSTSPFAPLVAWLGFGGTTFVLAWLTAFALACAVEPLAGMGVPDRTAAVLGRLLAVVVAVGLVLAVPPFRPTEAGTLRIGAVQPNTHAGYFDPLNDPARNLRATVQATLPLLDRSPALIVWPEGASEDDPLSDQTIQATMSSVAGIAGADLLTGALTTRDGIAYNSSLLVAPGAGVVAIYDKVHPVPFAEYVPDRAFWTPLAPGLLKMIGRDYAIGQRSAVLDVGRTPVGVDICFDIVDDGLLLGSVADGAQVLVAQTNNADFGTTEENEQQLAIARLRAIETGRSIVSDSTVASTTMIAPDGTTIAAAKSFRIQTLLADVPLATGITPAVAFGIPLNATIALLGGVLPLLLVLLTRRRRA